MNEITKLQYTDIDLDIDLNTWVWSKTAKIYRMETVSNDACSYSLITSAVPGNSRRRLTASRQLPAANLRQKVIECSSLRFHALLSYLLPHRVRKGPIPSFISTPSSFAKPRQPRPPLDIITQWQTQ